MHEALLVRFRTDDTMGFKGFSASYVAVDPFEEFDEMNSDSAEVTPFPGALKPIYSSGHDDFDEEEEEVDPDSNSFDPETNKIKSSELID